MGQLQSFIAFLALIVAGLVISTLGVVVSAAFRSSVDRVTGRCCTYFFLCLFLDLLAVLMGEVYRGMWGPADPALPHLYAGAVFLHYLCSPTLAYIMFAFVLSIADPNEDWKVLRYGVWGFWGVDAALLVLTQFNGLYYVIEHGNHVREGTHYWLCQLLSLVPLACMLAVMLLRRRRFSLRQWVVLGLACCLVPALAVAVPMFQARHSIIPSTIFCGYLMFLCILTNLTEQVALRRAENEELRTAVIYNRLQPHFISNVLDSIYYLCGTDPERAQKAVGSFAKYLRMNLSDLERNRLIPLRSELAHVENYLKLEQLSAGDTLHYELDWEEGDFDLAVPALCIQPMVENAVKRGLGRKEGGGTVWVRCRVADGVLVVTVRDDGVGFDPSVPAVRDSRPHIGLESSRARLRSMCGGSIKLESTPGVGTLATITIPQKERKEAAG